MDLYSTINSFATSFTNLSAESDGSLNEIQDFPPSDEPVYILGKKYSSLHELSDIRLDVSSRIWLTYRRNFAAIGDTVITSDSGWGCMLRVGQMVLAQALCHLHLGRDWRWNYRTFSSVQELLRNSVLDNNNKSVYDKYCLYRKILMLFADIKTAPYSIHQIALMGMSEEDKNVGEWFGPNTVAQVLKKLSVYDKMNHIYIHVALDNMLIIDDIKKSCKSTEAERKKEEESRSGNGDEEGKVWRPLLLFIPLRLGLKDIGQFYYRSLKTMFTFPQSLGILGGRPNHALYFIGCCGDDLIYLDPHTTHPAIDLTNDLSHLEESDSETCTSFIEMVDASYHCERASRIHISLLDPSIALAFFCKTEHDFDQLLSVMLKKLVQEEKQFLFEILKERPFNWCQFDQDQVKSEANPKSYAPSETDDEYEIID